MIHFFEKSRFSVLINMEKIYEFMEAFVDDEE